MKKKYPLEIVLRHTGTAELLDADDNTLWASDTDEDFREEISQEFLTEEDADDILDYLSEHEILTDSECAKFEDGTWDVTEESLTNEANDLHDEDGEDVDDEDDEDE